MPEETEPTVKPPPAEPKLEPDPDAQLRNMESQLAKTNQELERLKGAVAQPRPQAVTQGHQPNKEDMEKQFWQDPLNSTMTIAKYASQQAYEAARRDAGLSLEALSELAKEKIRSSDPEVFDKFQGEIEAMVATVPEQFKQNANVWRNAFNSVKGNHMDEIIKLKSGPRAPGGGDGPAPAGHRQAPAHKAAALSDDQAEFARKLGLTQDEYRRGLDLVEVMPNGKVMTKDGAFDQVMTFSSRDRQLKLKEAANAK